MSATVLERRNADGVLLRYEVGAREAFHDDRRLQPSDRLRMAVLRSERELGDLRTMVDCLSDDLSLEALEHFEWALHTIEATLVMARAELGIEEYAA